MHVFAHIYDSFIPIFILNEWKISHTDNIHICHRYTCMRFESIDRAPHKRNGIEENDWMNEGKKVQFCWACKTMNIIEPIVWCVNKFRFSLSLSSLVFFSCSLRSESHMCTHRNSMSQVQEESGKKSKLFQSGRCDEWMTKMRFCFSAQCVAYALHSFVFWFLAAVTLIVCRFCASPYPYCWSFSRSAVYGFAYIWCVRLCVSPIWSALKYNVAWMVRQRNRWWINCEFICSICSQLTYSYSLPLCLSHHF